jgi:hypothetical protein
MVEPVSIVFGSISLFFKLFDGFKRGYSAYKLTASFGDDFETAQRRFYILHIRLEEDLKIKLSWLRDDVRADIQDESSGLTKAILDQLALLDKCYTACQRLMDKYHNRGKVGMVDGFLCEFEADDAIP